MVSIKLTFYPIKFNSDFIKDYLLLFRLLIGAFIFIASMFLMLHMVQSSNSILITAHITKIENKQVTVGYEYKGEYYNRPINLYTSKLRIGDEIDINIDKNHPQQFFLSTENDFLTACTILGIIIIAISFIPFDKMKKNILKKTA